MNTIGRNYHFVNNCIVELTAYIFVMMVNFIFTPLIQIKSFEQNKFVLSLLKVFTETIRQRSS